MWFFLALCLSVAQASPEDPEATESTEASAPEGDATETAAEVPAEPPADDEAHGKKGKKDKKKFFRSDKDYVPPPERTEVMVFPVIAQNPDVGVMVGLSGSVARFYPDYDPYRWSVKANAIVSFREFQDKFSLLMQNYSLALDMPDLAEKRLRILPLVQFLRIPNASYYGIGNASDDADAPADDSTYYRYDKWLVQVAAPIEWKVSKVWKLQFALRYRYLDTNTYEGSLLEQQKALVDEDGDPLIYGAENQSDIVNSVTVKFDTRDWEMDPANGWLLQASARNTLGLAAGVKSYSGFGLDLRGYKGLIPKYLTLAGRLMADVQVGGVPFFELDRAGAFPSDPAIGGSSAVRGIYEGRFRGQSKVLGQIELRSWLFGHMLGSVHVRMGLEAFFDTGRVWAVTGKSNPELDGTGLGMKFGTGGGMRLGWGEYGVVRIDLAWSPDAPDDAPVGLYMDVMNAF